MQNVVDDVSLRLTAAGLTPTYTVVLLRLDSGALERKVLVLMLTKMIIINTSKLVGYWKRHTHLKFFDQSLVLTLTFPSVLGHCWLGNRKGIRPVKERWDMACVGLSVVMI